MGDLVRDGGVTGPAIYTATERERRLASEWHGGQASMLYAVASTGALSTGSASAAGLSGAAWERDLLERLGDELAEVIRLAVNDGDGDRETASAWLAKLVPLQWDRRP